MARQLENGAALEACYAAVERAAIEGRRCPENGTFSVDTRYMVALAHAGRIQIKISGHNYRTVTILQGEHAGKRTAPDPTGAKVWKMLDHTGTHWPRRHFLKRRQYPSVPGVLR